MKDGLYKIMIMDDFQYQSTNLRCWDDCAARFFIKMFDGGYDWIMTIVE